LWNGVRTTPLPTVTLWCAGSDGGSGRERTGQIPVVDEMMFGQPDVVEAEFLGVDNLIERLPVELC
jgi:hypothetical protein